MDDTSVDERRPGGRCSDPPANVWDACRRPEGGRGDVHQVLRARPPCQIPLIGRDDQAGCGGGVEDVHYDLLEA
jgi:hypothetical protein